MIGDKYFDDPSTRRACQEELVRYEAGKFPAEFGLRAFPGRRFLVDVTQSFWSDVSGCQLYVFERLPDGSTRAFSRDTPERLRRKVTP